MSFESLIKRISPTLKRITYKLNGHFSSFNHEDLYQEALLHLWLDFKQGRLTDKTDSYILQGCYFHLKNYIRKNRDRVCLMNLEGGICQEDNELENILSLRNQEDYFALVNCKILIEQIKHNGLTGREKEVFNLSLEDLTTREIGARLGISHVRVVKLKKRIKEKCKKYFKI
jgi:RNA polymerase sigma factor (sigma-70 family)